uniref:Lantibiotic n=1 Tax=Lactococcus lactis subsp. lactis TaxID=1360 RepID=A0A0M7BH60_LACLL|nr:LmgA-prelacticin LMG [Lactococcus lactis subsp. lactis]
MEKFEYSNLIQEVSDSELDEILGAGNGVIKTVSHECKMNTWQFLFTCCS